MKPTRSTHRTRSPLLRIIALPLLALGIALTLAIAGSSPAAASDPSDFIIPDDIENGLQIGRSAPRLADTTPPRVSRATINRAGTTLTINFSEKLAATSGFHVSQWSYRVDGGALRTTTSFSVGDAFRTLTLTKLSPPVYVGKTVRLSYRTSGSQRITDTSGNQLRNFSGFLVTNGSRVQSPKPTWGSDDTSGWTQVSQRQGSTCRGVTLGSFRGTDPDQTIQTVTQVHDGAAYFCTSSGWKVGRYESTYDPTGTPGTPGKRGALHQLIDDPARCGEAKYDPVAERCMNKNYYGTQ